MHVLQPCAVRPPRSFMHMHVHVLQPRALRPPRSFMHLHVHVLQPRALRPPPRRPEFDCRLRDFFLANEREIPQRCEGVRYV